MSAPTAQPNELPDFLLRGGGKAHAVEAALLSAWLAAWGVVELTVVALVIALVAMAIAPVAMYRVIHGSLPAFAALGFATLLVGFLCLWTISGVMAWMRWLRAVGGEERVRVEGEALVVETKAGRFKQRREIALGEIARLEVRKGGLFAETGKGAFPVATLGGRDSLARLRDELSPYVG